MHVLMLGWEFPPFITGGLGTACYGLTRALDQRGTRVTFVLPKQVDGSHAAHVNLVSPLSSGGGGGAHEAVPDIVEIPAGTTAPPGGGAPGTIRAGSGAGLGGGQDETRPGFENVTFLPVEAGFASPYQRQAGAAPVGAEADGVTGLDAAGVAGPGARARDGAFVRDLLHPDIIPGLAEHGRGEGSGPITDYDSDLIGQVAQYARFCARAVQGRHFDVIHAHDWMTYAAGLQVARLSGKPLVVHVHSTEFDRSGEHVNQQVYDIERRGMHGAMRVIAVSELTKSICVRRYGMTDHQVAVVYNGVELDTQKVGLTGIRRRDKIVLYFGRITYQKGPEYFVRAAKRVLEHLPDVKFVVAGSGDMAQHMIEMAAHMGIGHRVLFTGFLRGDDIKKVFSLADVYVMPSISEPFGIAPLEAMGHDVPALISKSSGVSEVLTHALKVDFWDVDDMANKIIAVLRHPTLRQTLQEHGRFEVRKLTWDGAAAKCNEVYQEVVEEMTHPLMQH